MKEIKYKRENGQLLFVPQGFTPLAVFGRLLLASCTEEQIYVTWEILPDGRVENGSCFADKKESELDLIRRGMELNADCRKVTGLQIVADL